MLHLQVCLSGMAPAYDVSSADSMLLEDFVNLNQILIECEISSPSVSVAPLPLCTFLELLLEYTVLLDLYASGPIACRACIDYCWRALSCQVQHFTRRMCHSHLALAAGVCLVERFPLGDPEFTPGAAVGKCVTCVLGVSTVLLVLDAA